MFGLTDRDGPTTLGAMRRPTRPYVKKSSSNHGPILIGAAVLVGLVGAMAMRGGGDPIKGVESVVAKSPPRDVVAENRVKYVEARHREIAAETFHGLHYAQLEPAWVAQSKAQAGQEYEALCALLREAEKLGQEEEKVSTYRAAADLVWPSVRDLARYGQAPNASWMRQQLHRAAETVRNP